MFPRAHSEVKSTSIGVPFAPIPLDVMRRSDLTPTAKLIFAAIANQARMRRGDSTLTNARIADAVGMTASGVRRPLDELEAAGLIERQYGESERVRASIRVTYAPAEVGAHAATQSAAGGVERQPGCGPVVMRVGAPAPALYTKNEEPGDKPIPSTEGEKTGTDPKPTPTEIAAAIRTMTAGKYAPVIWSPNAPMRPESTSPGRVDLPRSVNDRPAAPPRDAHELARGCFVDARRAAYVKPGGVRPKSAEQQLAELAAWRRRNAHQGR